MFFIWSVYLYWSFRTSWSKSAKIALFSKPTRIYISIYLSMSYKTARVSNVLLFVFFLNFRFMLFFLNKFSASFSFVNTSRQSLSFDVFLFWWLESNFKMFFEVFNVLEFWFRPEVLNPNHLNLDNILCVFDILNQLFARKY